MNKNEKQLTGADVRDIVRHEIGNALKPYPTKQDVKQEIRKEIRLALDEQNERNLAVFVTKDDLKESEGRLEHKLTRKLDEFIIRLQTLDHCVCMAEKAI